MESHLTGSQRLANEAGTALPLALFVLVILTALSIAFSSLAMTEPTIGRNHSMSAQARGFAESGIELVLYALNHPSDTTWGFTSYPTTVPSAYTNYGTFFRLSANGGFDVSASKDPFTNDLAVTVRGWAPDKTGQLYAAKRIQATLTEPVWAALNPPCALCVKGTLDLGGHSSVDGTGNFCSTGPTPLGASVSTSATNISGAASVAGSALQNQQPTVLNSMSWDDLALLRSVAQAAGPGHYYQGPTTFNSSNPLPAGGGIVFVDTTTGHDLTPPPSATPPEQMGSATINANLTWSGWIIAIGNVNVSGTVALTGTVYARNDFVFTGNGTISGNVTAENLLATQQSAVAASDSGNSSVVYNCPAAKNGGGTIVLGWVLKPQSYREVDGQN